MLEFDGRHGPVPAYGRCQPVDGGKRPRIVQIETPVPDTSALAVRHGGADVHRRRASDGLALVEGDGFLQRIVLGRQVRVVHRRCEVAVAEDGVSRAGWARRDADNCTCTWDALILSRCPPETLLV